MSYMNVAFLSIAPIFFRSRYPALGWQRFLVGLKTLQGKVPEVRVVGGMGNGCLCGFEWIFCF